jgi:hypothetical protein
LNNICEETGDGTILLGEKVSDREVYYLSFNLEDLYDVLEKGTEEVLKGNEIKLYCCCDIFSEAISEESLEEERSARLTSNYVLHVDVIDGSSSSSEYEFKVYVA